MKLSAAFIKVSIGILGVFILLTGVEYGFGIFDILDESRSETLQTGSWTAGTPIATAQEFYDVATSPTSNSTDFFYLSNDIDFAGFIWDYNSSYDSNAFKGTIEGNGYTLSNITITSSDTASVYISIFTRFDGGRIRDVHFENYTMGFSSAYFNAASIQAGLIAAEVRGSNNLIEGITINNVDIIANTLNGAGGLVGQVQGGADLTIRNIKASNLTVLNTSRRAGGLISRVIRGSGTIIIEDIELQGNIAGDDKISNTGGLIGTLQDVNGSISRAIVEYTAEGTIQLSDGPISMKAVRYVGGFIGNNKSSITISDSFYTGNLFTTYANLGSALGRIQGSLSLSNTYYSNVLFNDTYVAPTGTGLHGTLVNAQSMPDVTWWNGFATTYYSTNNLWEQDITGRLHLIR